MTKTKGSATKIADIPAAMLAGKAGDTVTIDPEKLEWRDVPAPAPIYTAVSTASGATVGASARSFGAALRDAGLNGSWADNAAAGAEYDGIRLVLA